MANYESNSRSSQPSLFPQVSGVLKQGQGQCAGILPELSQSSVVRRGQDTLAVSAATGGALKAPRRDANPERPDWPTEQASSPATTEQLPDVCRRRHGGNAQSEAANARVAPAKKGMRVAILSALAASDGLTLKELAKEFNKQLNQISGRVTELLADQLIERTSAEREGCAVLRKKGTA